MSVQPVGKAKSLTEFSLAKNIKDNKKDCYKDINGIRKKRECMSVLLKETEDLVNQDSENAKVLSVVFISFLSSRSLKRLYSALQMSRIVRLLCPLCCL